LSTPSSAGGDGTGTLLHEDEDEFPMTVPYATSCFSRSVYLVPDEPSYYIHRAEAYLYLNDFESALANFRKARLLIKDPPKVRKRVKSPPEKGVKNSTLLNGVVGHGNGKGGSASSGIRSGSGGIVDNTTMTDLKSVALQS
jgi:hypothetical protein